MQNWYLFFITLTLGFISNLIAGFFFSIITPFILLVEASTIYIILIPLIGILVILFTNSDMVKRLTSITPFIVKKNSILASRSNAALGDTVLYNIALFFSLLNLLVSVIM